MVQLMQFSPPASLLSEGIRQGLHITPVPFLWFGAGPKDRSLGSVSVAVGERRRYT